jgi:hypothetical protein
MIWKISTGVEEGFGLRGSGRLGRTRNSFNLIKSGRAVQKSFNLKDDNRLSCLCIHPRMSTLFCPSESLALTRALQSLDQLSLVNMRP